MKTLTFSYIINTWLCWEKEGVSLVFAYTQVSSLNETEAHVYNYVLNNKEKVLEESIRELAHDTHVSTATIVRFCKKLGCEGFLELKYKLKESITEEEHKEYVEGSSFYDFANYANSRKYLENIKRVADLIRQANSFFTLGIGGHGEYAKHVARRFSQIGYSCFGIVDKYYPMPNVPEGQKSVVLIAYDKKRENLIFEVIRKYKAKNYTIILFTAEDIGILEHLCDEVIYVSDGQVKMGEIVSDIPLLYTLERIMKELVNKHKQLY